MPGQLELPTHEQHANAPQKIPTTKHAVLSEVAHQHDISRQHQLVWRKAARAGQLSLAMDDAPAFHLASPENASPSRRARQGAQQVARAPLSPSNYRESPR
jgi:transposase-like protein